MCSNCRATWPWAGRRATRPPTTSTTSRAPSNCSKTSNSHRSVPNRHPNPAYLSLYFRTCTVVHIRQAFLNVSLLHPKVLTVTIPDMVQDYDKYSYGQQGRNPTNSYKDQYNYMEQHYPSSNNDYTNKPQQRRNNQPQYDQYEQY